MERKGKCLCHSLVCSAFTVGHGHARRWSWTSSLGCSACMYSMALWTRRKRRHRPITTPRTTLGRPRAHIRTKVLLRHILGMPLHGRAGIDLHLGQKPKLGAWYADDSLIYISYFVGTLYIHVSLSFLYCSCSNFYFPKTNRPKIFPMFLFVCLFSFLALVCFTCYFWFDIWKIQKIFCFVCCFLLFLFQNSKTQKYLLFFFGFVKFVAEFGLPWLHWSLVFTSYYSSYTSERQ
jgi:hypothetical protein